MRTSLTSYVPSGFGWRAATWSPCRSASQALVISARVKFSANAHASVNSSNE
jgi:hypothetical protein